MGEYRDDYEVVFVWNRSSEKMHGIVPQHLVLQDLSAAASKHPDLIIEVAHPSIIAEYGRLFLQTADFMVCTLIYSGTNSPSVFCVISLVCVQIGSPTALADAAVERKLVQEAREGVHGLYVPAGAFWGGQDVQKMADRGSLKVSSSQVGS